MTQLLRKRFEELQGQASALASTAHTSANVNGGSDQNVDREGLLAWEVKVKNLPGAACGRESEHYKAFVEAENYHSWSGNLTNFKRARAVFDAAREDFEGGYLVSVRSLVQAEVFETELEQARELLAGGYFAAAAVIAGVVLETTLRQLCLEKGLPIGKLDKMNVDLAKAGLYNSLVQKRVTVAVAVILTHRAGVKLTRLG